VRLSCYSSKMQDRVHLKGESIMTVSCSKRLSTAIGGARMHVRALIRFGLIAVGFYGMAVDVVRAQTPPPAWTQVGMLTCRVNPSIGFVIFGHQSMECTLAQNALPPQRYEGALNTVGIDIGVTAGGVLGWAVFAPTQGAPAGALAGEYVGASGDIGLGFGAGVNVLMGGSGRTFALQPVSLEGSVGVNVALGVSGLKLRAVY
jgi:hypothetical protein